MKKKKSSSVLGSKKPYYQPHVLGPKDKVDSVGPILGGKPKRNKALTTKFFGGCSADNDPGDKKVLSEIVIQLLEKFNKFK